MTGQYGPDRREILEFSGPHVNVGFADVDKTKYWYAEGHSPVVDEREGGGNWFCFEEPYEKAVSELRKLGFTRAEIVEAEMNQATDDDGEAVQRQEMRAETFAAEALMGMRPGTTEGWYDEPEPPDPYDDAVYDQGEDDE